MFLFLQRGATGVRRADSTCLHAYHATLSKGNADAALARKNRAFAAAINAASGAPARAVAVAGAFAGVAVSGTERVYK